ncbi:MAG: trehalase-like domain-containing protein, partial [Longimicrobiales bacterium]
MPQHCTHLASQARARFDWRLVQEARYPPIGDLAVIGDSRSIALVSRSGSIDWWCLPRFDGDAVFARLLDAERGGSFEISPDTEFEATRAYIEDTNVLITHFRTRLGEVKLTDFMP